MLAQNKERRSAELAARLINELPGQRLLKFQVMRAIRENRWHYCLVGFLLVDIRWRKRVRSNHGPSSTTEIYLLHCRHPGEGVGRLRVAGVEPRVPHTLPLRVVATSPKRTSGPE